MYFCDKCGVPVVAAFCPRCGAEKPTPLPPMTVTSAASKFCPTCGKQVGAAYCTGCGAQIPLTINYGKVPVFGGGIPAYGSGAAKSGTPLGIPGMPIPVEWLLMGIMLLFALSTMTFFGGVMLVVALVPAAILVIDRKLYDRFKLFVGAGSAGLGLVFAALATFTGIIRLHPVALVLCALGFFAIAFISAREEVLGLRFPPGVQKIFEFLESPMYFYIVALYFSMVTVFLRVVYVFALFNFREVISANYGAGWVFLSLVFIVLMLVPVGAVAYFTWRGIAGMVDKAVFGLCGSAVGALIIIPLFFRRTIGVPILFVLAGFAGVALAGLVVFFLKVRR